MTRVLSAATALALATFLAGCPDPKPATCGSYEAMVETLDLSGCSANEISAIDRSGIWHGLISVPDEGGQRMVIDFTAADDPKWDGSSTYLDDFASGRFYMQQAFVDLSNSASVTTSVLACRVPSTGKITGLVQICATGSPTSNGTFELQRLAPIDGEGSSSGGLTLVSEKKVSEGTPRDVTFTAEHAFVTTPTGVSVFRLSTNQECGRLGAAADKYWTESIVVGDRLYIGSLADGLIIANLGTNACALTYNGVPRLPGMAIQALLHDPANNLVFAASLFGDILVLDVTNPGSPVKVNQFRATEHDYVNGAWPHGMYRSGDKLYVNYGSAGYVIFQLPTNLTDGVPPGQLAAAFAPDGENSVSNGIVPVADKLYAAETIQGWNGHVRILDVTNPTAPTAVASFALRPEISVGGIDVVGTKLYIAYHQDGLRVIDLADPAAPAQVAHYNTWDLAQSTGSYFEGLVSVRAARDGSGLIYAVDTQRGLMVFDETP